MIRLQEKLEQVLNYGGGIEFFKDFKERLSGKCFFQAQVGQYWASFYAWNSTLDSEFVTDEWCKEY